jgi:pyruvate/2-oxoglutarate dehydrogenase complex dihydrolipoamide acyltransferase (E2) component
VPAAPVIQTVTAEPAPADQTQQVVPQPDVPPIEEPAAVPDTAAPTTSATPAVAPGAAAAPDELVKKLFDPLLRRLKAELRLDRERRGVLTDLRH